MVVLSAICTVALVFLVELFIGLTMVEIPIEVEDDE